MGRKIVASFGAFAIAAALATAGMGRASAAPAQPWPVGVGGGSDSGPAAVYKGYYVMTDDSTATPGQQLMSTSCTSGYLTGGGLQLKDSDLADNIGTSSPFDGSWVTQVSDETSHDAPMTAYAVCVKKVAKYSQVRTTFDNPAGAQTQVTATCPGKTVVLDGGVTNNASDLPDGVTLNSSFPLNSKEWIGYINNASSEDESVSAWAVCAKKPTGYHIEVGKGTTVPPMTQASDTATCPSGTLAVGGGGLSHSSSTAVSVNSTYPDGVTAWRATDNNRSAYSTTVVSYAICAKAT